jgi:hypothetical protein
MKTTFVVFFVLFAAAAFAQTAPVLPNQVQMVVMPEHIEHASQHDLATERPLVGGGGYTYAQGERPLWEFGPVLPPPTPLGDVARAYRKEKEKLNAPKAEVVFEKQGS